MDSLLVMLDEEGFAFSNIHRIRQLNSMPKAGGSLDLADSAAHAISRLDILLVIAKLSPFLRTDSSDSVRTWSDKFMTNFSEPWVVPVVLVVWWWFFRAKNFRIWISFRFTKWCLYELSTAAMMRSWSEWLVDLRKNDSRSLISLLSADFLNLWNWILSLRRALLARKVILKERWLWYGAFNNRPLGTMSWILHFIRKVRWLEVLANWILSRSNFLKLGYIPGIYTWYISQF